jgi:hypothetical protein
MDVAAEAVWPLDEDRSRQPGASGDARRCPVPPLRPGYLEKRHPVNAAMTGQPPVLGSLMVT